MEDVSDRIKRLRKELKTTQAGLGGLAGVTKQAVNQWEKGTTKPERDALLKLKSAKRVNPDWVDSGTGDMFLSDSFPARVTPLVPPPDPLIAELVALAGRMDRTGLARLVERAVGLAEQYPRAQANPAQ